MPNDLKRWNGTQWVRLLGDLRGPVVIDGAEAVKKSDWTAWANITLSANWANYGGSWQVAQWRYSAYGGELQLRGLIKWTSATATTGTANIFTAGVGYRPLLQGMFHCHTTNGYGRVDIWNTGALTFQTDGSSVALTTNEWLSLDNCRWSTV